MAHSSLIAPRLRFVASCALLCSCAPYADEEDVGKEDVGEISDEVLSTVSALPDAIRSADISAAATPGTRALITQLDKALGALRQTEFSYLNTVNFSTGVYRVVCTPWVEANIDAVRPLAFDDVQEYADQNRPTCARFSSFIRSVGYTGNRHWRRVATVAEIRPGDVIAIKFADPDAHGGTSGHCSIVINVPQPDERFSRAWAVRVSDASSSRHSNDSRPSGVTGVGVGTLMLRSGTDGRPVDWAWSLLARWYGGVDQISIGRLVD